MRRLAPLLLLLLAIPWVLPSIMEGQPSTLRAKQLIITDGQGSVLQVPRLTTVQRDASSHQNGEIIYCTDCAPVGFYAYRAGAWSVFAESASGLTVQEADGLPSHSAISTLIFDQADGFVVTQPAAGQIRIDLGAIAAASGGTGIDTSASTGTLRVDAGTWTAQHLVRLPRSDETTYAANANADASRGVKLGTYTYLRQVSGAAAAKIIPGVSFETFVLTTNAYYDSVAATWKSIASGQVTALVIDSGSAWFAFVTTNPGGADVAINTNGGADPAWAIGSKFYSTPTGNVGIGRRFDGSVNSGTVGGEPEGKLHLAADGNIRAIIQTSETSANASILEFRKSRGTMAAPSDVADADVLGSISWYAKSGAVGIPYHAAASITSRVDGTYTSGQRPPSRIEFETNEANTGAVERFRIRGDGSIWTGNNVQQITKTSGHLTGAMEPTTLAIAGGAPITRILSGTATWNPGTVLHSGTASTTFGVTNAIVGNPVFAGFSSITEGGWHISGTVTGAGDVNVTISNFTGGPKTPGSGTVRAVVVQF